LLRTIALAPRLSDDDVKIERALQAEDAARAADDLLRYPVQRALRHAFGDHPYGLPILGDAEVVGRLESSAVRSLAEVVRRLRPAAVAVGDLEAAALLQTLAPLVEWPSDRRNAVRLEPPAFSPSRGSERRDKAQTALALAFPAPNAMSPDRFAVDVVAAILSSLAGRLFEALREKRSLAYTVTATPWLRREAGAVLAYIATSPEREDEARRGMLEELERLASDRVPEDELERARRYAAGLVEVGRQRAAAVAGEVLEAFVAGTLADLAQLPERLRAVTAEDVRRVAEAVF
jgi:zinc protease